MEQFKPLFNPYPPLEKLSAWQRFLIGMPFISPYADLRSDLEDQLESRSPATLDAWPQQELTRPLLTEISHIVMTHMEWPIPHYLPQDPCSLLFYDGTADLKLYRCLRALTKTYNLPKNLFPDLTSLNFDQFVERVTQNYK